jgi:di/tricarboxylate transporter
MTTAHWSLAALVLTIVLSCTSRINVGLVGLGLAWLIAVTGGAVGVDGVFAAFPAQLFLTLVGVTALFGAAESNGTLERLARGAFRTSHARLWQLPVLFFLAGFAVSAVGPGAIASTALVAPLAMGLAARAGAPAFLCALMVCNGANAGNLSPVSAVGLLASTLMSKNGLAGHEWSVFAMHAAAHGLVACGAYLALGGIRLGRTSETTPSPAAGVWERRHLATAAIVAAWVAGVVALHAPAGLLAFAATVLLVVTRQASDKEALERVPWGIILMVCGMTVLIGVLEKSGGLELFTRLLALTATPATANGVIAFVTGIISTYSSTSGVVLPAFLPIARGLADQVGGGDPLQLSLSIIVGSALVDVSPLSTLGALCVAAHPVAHERHQLFRSLLLWGLSMTIVGALLSAAFAPVFAG